jgi:hypothetical protein
MTNQIIKRKLQLVFYSNITKGNPQKEKIKTAHNKNHLKESNKKKTEKSKFNVPLKKLLNNFH